MASHTEENYLKTLLSLSWGKEQVSLSDLSNDLKVKLPTANSMIKNLKSQGLVNYEKYKPVSLTGKGTKMAALVLRKHRLTEMFLTEVMGFGWEEVHEIAEQVEHISSPAFFDKMDEMLGSPKTDPHGSPIPDRKGNIIHSAFIPLSACKPEQSVRISAILNDSAEFLGLLNSKELALGTEMTIIAVEAFDGSITVSYNKYHNVTLSEKVSQQILVSVE
ncbi:metal-dependent transcriptional regulator [Saccharicrinis sp. FJH54]|uniref:metal-dependent transcriptional regulator n=1 Tax=Saccharicrinis sp. FJH54 TaxID=3344665 RepID=UPI0035D4F24A